MSNYDLDDSSDCSQTFLKSSMNCAHGDMLINTALAATWIAMQTHPAEAVVKSMSQRFSLNVIKEAKKALWGCCSNSAIGKRKTRRDTHERTEVAAHCKDIVTALQQLDAKSAVPRIAVEALDLHFMPTLCEETSSSDSARSEKHVEVGLQPLNDRLTGVETLCSDLKGLIASLSQQVASLSSDTKCVQEVPPTTEKTMLSPRDHSQRNVDPRVSKDQTGKPALRQQSFATVAADIVNGDDSWTKVGPRNRNRRAKVIKGTQESTGRFRGAPEPMRDIFVYRVNKECEPDDIRAMLRENNCDIESIVVTSDDNAKFRSFKITVKASVANALLSDTFPWPNGVRVRRFFLRKGKEEITSSRP